MLQHLPFSATYPLSARLCPVTFGGAHYLQRPRASPARTMTVPASDKQLVPKCQPPPFSHPFFCTGLRLLRLCLFPVSPKFSPSPFFLSSSFLPFSPTNNANFSFLAQRRPVNSVSSLFQLVDCLFGFSFSFLPFLCTNISKSQSSFTGSSFPGFLPPPVPPYSRATAVRAHSCKNLKRGA